MRTATMLHRLGMATSLAALLLSSTLIRRATAQTTSEVTGSVTDSTGAAVPEATVVITSVETNARRQTRTNEAGLYRLTLLIEVGRR